MGAVKRDLEERTINKADEIAEQRYGREFCDLPNHIQHEVWCEAESIVRDKVADQADAIYERMRDRRNGTGETHWDRLELDRRLGK